MERLTPDLAMDILSRLPIRSLLRAKCVCKSWHILTSDPILSTLHFNRSSINDDAILVTYSNKFFGQQEFYFSEQPSLSKENISLFTKKIHLSFINGMERLQIQVVGTCKGLLCLATIDNARGCIPKSIHILNPITGEHQQLPDLGITRTSKCPGIVKYGFGFDDRMNVFKVVLFISQRISSSTYVDVNVNEMQILTVGLVSDNKWRRQLDNLPNVLFCSLQKDLNAFVNGFLHLIGTTSRSGVESDIRTVVVAFHLGSEDFQVIQTPESIALKKYQVCPQFLTLGVIDNCLSFVDASNDGFVEIWLRKIENGIFSWIKTFSIHGKLIGRSAIGGKLVLLKYRKDGELLLQLYNHLLSYNAKINTSKIFEIWDQAPEEIYCTETFPFVGSLISIKSQA